MDYKASIRHESEVRPRCLPRANNSPLIPAVSKRQPLGSWHRHSEKQPKLGAQPRDAELDSGGQKVSALSSNPVVLKVWPRALRCPGEPFKGL